MTTITSSQFLDAFSKVWKEHLNKRHDAVMAAYMNDKTWTNYMLSYGGFLNDVMLRLSKSVVRLAYSKEIYSIDAIFVGGKNLFRDNLCYPSELHVLIEHEQGEHIEEEMWKLIFWRAPLKVLICYDWNNDEKKKKERKSWLTNKLKALIEMLDEVNRSFPEVDTTEYLFIIGNRDSNQGEVNWRWASKRPGVKVSDTDHLTINTMR